MRLSDEQTDEVVAAIADALVDAELTVEELGERVIDAHGAVGRPSGCSPPSRRTGPAGSRRSRPPPSGARSASVPTGAAARPTRTRRRGCPASRRWPDRDRPGRRWCARSSTRYGPATVAQIARWLAVPAAGGCGRGSTRLGAELEPVRLDGAEDAWVLAGDTAADDPAEGVRLLPYFDAYGVGAHPRPLVFPGVAAERALANNQAGTVPVLLVDGVVAGVGTSAALAQPAAARDHRRAVRPRSRPAGAASSTTRSPASARSSRPPPSSRSARSPPAATSEVATHGSGAVRQPRPAERGFSRRRPSGRGRRRGCWASSSVRRADRWIIV